MNQPFSVLLTDVTERLSQSGGLKEEFRNLTPEQREQVEDLMAGVNARDSYNQMMELAGAVNSLNKIVGGFTSDDISIEVNAQTGQSRWRVRPKMEEKSEGGDADLGTAEKEYMVYQRKKDVTPEGGGEDVPDYGFDYMRSVAATEE